MSTEKERRNQSKILEREGGERERERDRDKQTDRQTETENSNSKTLVYKDCSLGSVKNLTTSPWLLMSRYQMTGIIYVHIGMDE